MSNLSSKSPLTDTSPFKGNMSPRIDKRSISKGLKEQYEKTKKKHGSLKDEIEIDCPKNFKKAANINLPYFFESTN